MVFSSSARAWSANVIVKPATANATNIDFFIEKPFVRLGAFSDSPRDREQPQYHNFSCDHPQPARLGPKVADSGHYGNCGLAGLCALIPVHTGKRRVRGRWPFPGRERKMMHALAT